MKTPSHFLAFDLGATSGRSALGTLHDNKLTVEELTRFPNQLLAMGPHFHWDIQQLFECIKDGLRAAAARGVELSSVGIDTWGVDIALFDADGRVIQPPFAYRDPYTNGMPERFFENIMPLDALYNRTGIQIMNFNTVFQLYAIQQLHPELLQEATAALFMPDALSYLLTGKMITEYTIASTSGMMNPITKEMDADLMAQLGIRPDLFPPIVMPGQAMGYIKESIMQEVGLTGQLPVMAVAGHDTASAVAAVPAANSHFAYLSSGTWSLMGIETPQPVMNDHTRALNFTNEGGIDGTIRLLKNIPGMWLFEQCLKEWKEEGASFSYAQAVEMARKATSECVIDPSDPRFDNPASMPQAIVSYCTEHKQEAPQTYGEFIRTIYHSLALKYRHTLDNLQELAPFPIEVLHIIGGGSRNDYLNQLTANATGLPVVAGPAEATAIGNLMLQAMAAGIVKDLQQMRSMISQAIETKTFMPQKP